MSQRSKNLLEAFNQSKAPEKSAQPAAQPRGSAPQVGGPFADAGPMPRAKAEVKAQVEGAGAQSSRLRVALLCGLVAVTFFFIGRVSVPSVQAAGEPSTPSAVNVAKNPLAPVGDAPAKSIAEALKDPANKFSILAISYKFVDGDDRLAKATQDSLIAQGLPTALCKNVVKKQCFLLVGAAPKLPDLDSLLAKVKQATSERGKQDFTSAYGVPIDNYLAR